MYVISYFTSTDEALHLATSQDGVEFVPLNGGAPVLRGGVGTRTLRDPFVGIGPDGQYHLLATDGWTSPYIVHATSTDLLTWSEQRLLPVMAGIEGAHNAWAPEFFADETGRYCLIWSSVVAAGATADGQVWQHIGQDHRIWSCTTEDFRSFSPAEPFFDPGYPVIDATVHPVDGGGYLMAFKDERGTNHPDTRYKDIHVTTFAKPGGPYRAPVGPVTPTLVEGPTLYRRGGEWVMLFDRFLEGSYGALASTDGVSWRPTDVALPRGMRHASVLTITDRRASAQLAVGKW